MSRWSKAERYFWIICLTFCSLVASRWSSPNANEMHVTVRAMYNLIGFIYKLLLELHSRSQIVGASLIPLFLYSACKEHSRTVGWREVRSLFSVRQRTR